MLNPPPAKTLFIPMGFRRWVIYFDQRGRLTSDVSPGLSTTPSPPNPRSNPNPNPNPQRYSLFSAGLSAFKQLVNSGDERDLNSCIMAN